MNPPKKERNNAIGKAYLEGVPIRLIAIRFSTSEPVVCNVARRLNLPKRYRTIKCLKSHSTNPQLELPLTSSPRTSNTSGASATTTKPTSAKSSTITAATSS